MAYPNLFRDQMGEMIRLECKPHRIISLVPSQTELLIDLGLAENIVGRTKFCIHPKDKVANIPKIGGTKTPSIEKITQLKPDLIIGNKEENDKESISRLKSICPVWMSDIVTIDQALEMIESIAHLTDTHEKARVLLTEIKGLLGDFQEFIKIHILPKNLTALYMIWRKPFMAAGSDTFINSMLLESGFKNLLSNEGRYPVISAEQLKSKSPDIIFLSSEPYPFSNKHVLEIQEICPNSRVILVDGEMFSWYGSRLKLAFPYFKQLFLSL